MAETYWQKLAAKIDGYADPATARILEEELSGAFEAIFAAECKWCRESQQNLMQHATGEELWHHMNTNGTWFKTCQASHLRSALAERGLR